MNIPPGDFSRWCPGDFYTRDLQPKSIGVSPTPLGHLPSHSVPPFRFISYMWISKQPCISFRVLFFFSVPLEYVCLGARALTCTVYYCLCAQNSAWYALGDNHVSFYLPYLQSLNASHIPELVPGTRMQWMCIRSGALTQD